MRTPSSPQDVEGALDHPLDLGPKRLGHALGEGMAVLDERGRVAPGRVVVAEREGVMADLAPGAHAFGRQLESLESLLADEVGAAEARTASVIGGDAGFVVDPLDAARPGLVGRLQHTGEAEVSRCLLPGADRGVAIEDAVSRRAEARL